jgi:transcriptional regulator with XRE-family HTH domain
MTMTTIQTLSQRLNERREDLGMTCAVLAERTGLSLRTVQRVLSGDEKDPGFATVTAIAKALGVSLCFAEEQDINTLRLRQAERKAERLVSLVRGTSALEAQPVHKEMAKTLRDRTVKELLSGSSRKLWAE